MDRALDIRDEGAASLRRSPFVRRSVGLMAIGLINFLLLAALGVLLFTLVQMRLRRVWWTLDFSDPANSPMLMAFGATNALLMAFCILFAAFLVLVTQSLRDRAVVGAVVLFFLVIALSCPGIGHAVGLEHILAFWSCVLILIPLRAMGNWSIHWSDQIPGRAGAGQFSLANLLTWTTAIAVTVNFLRLFFGTPVHAVWFSATPVRYVASVSTWTCAAFLAAIIVAGPCLWLAASRYNRLRGTLWIAAWIVAVSLLWGVGSWLSARYVARWAPGLHWGYMVLYGCEAIFYLLVLEAALLANLFALEWLGVRWTRPLARAP